MAKEIADKELLIPRLKFNEFENESWSKHKIDNVISIKSDKFNPEKETSIQKCIELEHISQGTGNLLGFSSGNNVSSIKNKFKKGNVLYGKLRPYLKKYLIAPFDGVCSSEIWVMKAKGMSNGFLFQYVQTDQFNNLTKLATGTKMPRADWSIISKESINFPSLPEQQKIASFLSAVDEKIQLLTRKKELVEKYKKGVMQKIFSGELRFKDEKGKDFPKWEEKKLGDIGSTFNGLTNKTKEDFGDGKPYIQYMQIFKNSRINPLEFGLVKISEDDKQNLAQYGDVFFTTSSETPLEIGTSSILLDNIPEVYLNSFCFGFRPKSLKTLVPEFSQFLFRSAIFRRNIIPLAQGSTRYNMSKVELMKLKIKLPCYSEQKKIADFLSSLDSKIEIINKQITQTQEFKKGLLQQMFV